jgi:cell division protease FtsH
MEKTDESKQFKDISVSEYINARKRANWNASQWQAIIRQFLGYSTETEGIEGVFNLNETISNYEKHIICAVYDDYLALRGYEVIRAFDDHDSSDIHPFQFEKLETSFQSFKKVVDDGTMLIQSKTGPKLAIDLDYYTPESYKIKIYAEHAHAYFAEEFLSGLKDYAKTHNYLKNKKIMPDYSFIEINSTYTWDSVILDSKTKAKIRHNIDTLLDNISIYEINKVPFKRGLILKGVPGVGKTLIGKVLCNVANSTLIWVTPKYLERSSNVAAIGELARELAPTILFLEDIDLYGESRDSSTHKTLLGELMNQLDGISENKNIIVVATTNRGDELEKALRNRPGRFDSVIEIKKPAVPERKAMLKHYVDRFKHDGIDFDVLATDTDDYTGAHIKDLVDLAVMTAIEEGSLDVDKKIILTHAHLDRNVKLVGKRKIPIGFNTKPDTRKRGNSLDAILDDEYSND